MRLDQNVSTVFDLREILNVLFKYKRAIIGICLTATFIATIIAFLVPKTFEAKACLLVKFGREFIARPGAGNEGIGYAIPPGSIVNGEIQIFKSKDVIGKTVAVVGVESLYPNITKNPPEGLTRQDIAVDQFLKNFDVKAIPGSSLIEASFKHRSPDIALKAMNSVVDAYVEKHLDVFGGGKTTDFLKNQLQAYENRLNESENSLESFKQKNNVFSLDEQKSSLLMQSRELDTSYKTILSQIRELEEKVIYVKSAKWPAEASPEVRARMVVLQQKEHDLSERYTENSRFVQDVRRELDGLKALAQKNIEENRSFEIGKLEREISALRARADTTKRQLANVNGELQFYDSQAKEFQRRKRQVSMRESQFQTYANKAEESLILDSMDREKMVNVAVVEPASLGLSMEQKILRKKVLIPIGFFGGAACGIALAFFLEFFSMVMTSPRTAEQRLGLPVLVAIRLAPEKVSLPGGRS